MKIYLPPPPAIHVEERSGAKLALDQLKELVDLARFVDAVED